MRVCAFIELVRVDEATIYTSRYRLCDPKQDSEIRESTKVSVTKVKNMFAPNTCSW